MFSGIRKAAIGAAAVGLALTGSAHATVLVDYNDGAFVHVEFVTPTFLTSFHTTTFTFNDPGDITEFAYSLPGDGASCVIAAATTGGPCDAFTQGLTPNAAPLSATANPDVFTDAAGGTLTFNLPAVVPEPASLTLLAVALAGLGVVLRTRRS
jgi:hypothetical protein